MAAVEVRGGTRCFPGFLGMDRRRRWRILMRQCRIICQPREAMTVAGRGPGADILEWGFGSKARADDWIRRSPRLVCPFKLEARRERRHHVVHALGSGRLDIHEDAAVAGFGVGQDQGIGRIAVNHDPIGHPTIRHGIENDLGREICTGCGTLAVTGTLMTGRAGQGKY